MFVPMPDDQVGRLALIEAIRANTDAVQRLARHVETQDGKLEGIKDQLGEMKTSIALLQSTRSDHDTLELQVEKLVARVSSLEADRERLRGERGLIAAIFNGKVIPWVITAGAVIAAWIKGAFE